MIYIMIPGSANRREFNERKNVIDFSYSSEEDGYEFDESEFIKMREEVNQMYNNYRNDMIDNLVKINNLNVFHDKRDATYQYGALKNLKQDIESELDKYDNAKINMCVYQVNKEGKNPFLQYVLFKSLKNEAKKNTLTFPSFKRIEGEDVLSKCENVMQIMLLSYFSKANYSYKGFVNENENFYVFYDVSCQIIDCHELCSTHDLWLTLIDEITNHKYVCNYNIDEKVYDFFIKNKEFNYLQDENGSNYETPIIGYSGSRKEQLKFMAMFGETKTNKITSQKNEHYYFSDYNKAVEWGGWNKNEKYLNGGGILRFALFAGNTKVLKEGSDEWSDEFDSAYINYADADGKESAPLWIVKEYEQQTPLTFHVINKKTLGNKWERTGNYAIY